MNPLKYKTFDELIRSGYVRIKVHKMNVKAMEAVDLLETIKDLGNQIFLLRESGNLKDNQAKPLLLKLIQCFANPIEEAKQVVEIKKQLERIV